MMIIGNNNNKLTPLLYPHPCKIYKCLERERGEKTERSRGNGAVDLLVFSNPLQSPSKALFSSLSYPFTSSIRLLKTLFFFLLMHPSQAPQRLNAPFFFSLFFSAIACIILVFLGFPGWVTRRVGFPTQFSPTDRSRSFPAAKGVDFYAIRVWVPEFGFRFLVFKCQLTCRCFKSMDLWV